MTALEGARVHQLAKGRKVLVAAQEPRSPRRGEENMPGGGGRNGVTYQSGQWEGVPHFLSAPRHQPGRGRMTSAAAANDVMKRPN